MSDINFSAYRQPHSHGASLDPRGLADIAGVVERGETCRLCGAFGTAIYLDCGWGFQPFGRCGKPLKCGDRPNMQGEGFALIRGGRAS